MTWQNRYEVRKADGVGGDPIPDDEPVLVIRAQDVLALEMLDDYMAAYCNLTGWSADDVEASPVIARVAAHREALVEWQKENRHRMKVAD